MSSRHVDTCANAALKAANGNVSRAVRELEKMADQDSLLYDGLTRPLLRAVCTAAIKRALEPKPTAPKLSSSQLDHVVDLLAAKASGKPASETAIRTVAKAFKQSPSTPPKKKV